MGKHPIRCEFMCPLRIALTLGQLLLLDVGSYVICPKWPSRRRTSRKKCARGLHRCAYEDMFRADCPLISSERANSRHVVHTYMGACTDSVKS